MPSGKSQPNQRLSVHYVIDLTLAASQVVWTGENGWQAPSRRQTYARASRTAAKCSGHSLSRAAQKILSSTCGATGYVGEVSGSYGPGAVPPATEPSVICNQHGVSFGSSTSSAASQSIRPGILTSGSLLACRQTTLGTPSRMGPLPLRALTRPPNSVPTRAQALIAVAFVAAAIAIPRPACADALSVAEFGQFALRCGPSVAPSTLASIARTESAFEPLSINDNTTGTSGVPATHAIAVQIASKLLEAGHSVDIGIMQINSANFSRLGLTLETAFDPCRSIAAGAAILAGDYDGGPNHEGQQSALRVAISKYNTGDAQRGFINGYVRKVELAAGRIVPALDVGLPPAAIDSQSPPAAAPIAPTDPNSPPSWDVWSSFDYAATHNQDADTPPPSMPAPGSAVLADAERGPTAAVTVSAPTLER